jgi:hypothetical protein
MPRRDGPPSLLEQVQRLLERTYRMRSGIDDPGSFVIGDRGLRALYGPRHVGEEPVPARTAEPCGARLLVRDADDGVRACLYYPDDLIARLERFPPSRGIGDENVDEFAVLVEELDHLLLLGERALARRPLSLFEMELHANVSKHLVLARYLAGPAARLEARHGRWLRFHLFDKVRFCDDDPDVRQRYVDARQWAVRLLDALAGLPVEPRIAALRRFHGASGAGKIDLIRELADGVAAAGKA